MSIGCSLGIVTSTCQTLAWLLPHVTNLSFLLLSHLTQWVKSVEAWLPQMAAPVLTFQTTMSLSSCPPSEVRYCESQLKSTASTRLLCWQRTWSRHPSGKASLLSLEMKSIAFFKSHTVISALNDAGVSWPVARKEPSFEMAMHEIFLSTAASRKNCFFETRDRSTTTDPNGKTMNRPHRV